MVRPGCRFVAAVGVAAALISMVAGCRGDNHQSSAPPATTPTPQTGASRSPVAAPVPAVQWTGCRDGAGPSGYQCASVAVPRNPAQPDGATIAMAIDRHPATGDRIGSLLVNPGGPGVSGVDWLPNAVSMMPSDLLARFDVVGFDPPGVGRTAPVTCVDNAGMAAYLHLDPEPPTAGGFAAMVAADRAFAAGCQARSGAELPYVSTVDAARDMDVLRQALGDAKLTYLGGSYGTFLGATYASLFPTHVRAMVLDGDIDPALPVVDELNQQSAGLEAQLQQFIASCRTTPSCAWRPASLSALENLVSRVRANPLPVGHTGRTVGPAEVLFGSAAALYAPYLWPTLATALEQATNGNGTGLLQLFDGYMRRAPNGSYTNLFEIYPAVYCLDWPAPTIAQIQAAAPAAEAAAPLFGLQNLYSELDCSVWPVSATGKVGPISAAGSPPILVVGSTGDPVTPYQWSQALARELADAVLLTRVGDGHTAYGASSCIRTHVDQYLIGLVLPPAGTRCPSD
jgi:pimeloyl-ACP methyl ester carboxylesterase